MAFLQNESVSVPTTKQRVAMRSLLVVCLAIASPCSLSAGDEPRRGGEARGGDETRATPGILHTVYFQLKDKSPAAREKLLEACRTYLTGHRGETSFTLGARAEELKGEKNDADFDVSISLVFRNKAALDAYAESERHKKFIAECKENWQNVRVFDSMVLPGPRDPGRSARREGEGDREGAPRGDRGRDPEPDIEKKYPLPDSASSFAGMVRGKVVEKGAREGRSWVVLQVEDVPQSWEHSKAQDAKAMVGKKVVVQAAGEGPDARRINRFLRGLETGATVSLDVAHRRGDVLGVVELTEEQRRDAETKR